MNSSALMFGCDCFFIAIEYAATLVSATPTSRQLKTQNLRHPNKNTPMIRKRFALLILLTLATAPLRADELGSSPGWQFFEERDPFSGANTSRAVFPSDADSAVGYDHPRALVVRCSPDPPGFEVIMVSDGYIGSRNDRIPMRFRFGDNVPVEERWHESTSGTAAFLPRGYQDFLAGLASREDFVFEITDYRGSTSHARFSGLSVNDDALEYVLGGCDGEAP